MSINLLLDQRASLTTLYGQPQRFYHTLAHVHQLLREIETLSVDPKTKDILEIAAWFHDAVYDPFAPRGKNEEDSYNLLMYTPLGNLTGKLCAGYCIRATKDHVVTAETTPENQEIVRTFLDLDLSILGKPPEVYADYAQNIRLEYVLNDRFITEEQYTKGRMAFLITMLARERIYQTSHFFDKFEVQARKNMQEELDDLTHLYPLSDL